MVNTELRVKLLTVLNVAMTPTQIALRQRKWALNVNGHYNAAGLCRTNSTTSVSQEVACQLHCDEGHAPNCITAVAIKNLSKFIEPEHFSVFITGRNKTLS